ncbi:MAG: hypothetical protein ACYDIE_11165 [Candidatus Krumholzibacteriia bacterium]
MTLPEQLQRTVTEFNSRRYVEAAAAAREGSLLAPAGRDALFWNGLQEACVGFALLTERKLGQAEVKMVAAIEKLRNFGYLYQDVEVTSVLAGLRLGVEEIRNVRDKRKSQFDMSLLPSFRMVARAKAQDR